MTDLLIRDIEPETRAELEARAHRHGRSLSAEARSVLRAGMSVPEPEEGLGTRISRRFAKVGFTKEEHSDFEAALQRLRGQPQRPPPDFSE